jgi:carbamoyltransferase
MEKGAWILGISASPHNGAMCLLRGDEIVVAIQEERLSRRKRDGIRGAHPSLALDYCLSYAGVRAAELSMVVCCVTNSARAASQDVALNPVLRTALHKIPTLYIPHHYGHALSAFMTSGFGEAAVLVIDGLGSPAEDLTADELAVCLRRFDTGSEIISLYAASDASLRPLEKHLVEGNAWVTPNRRGMPYFGSLGGMYASSAAQIFGDLHESGKVMGLAPYGEPEIPTEEFYDLEGGQFVFSRQASDRFNYHERWPERGREYKNLAASTQRALEEAVLYLTSHLHDLCPSENLCYAGGVALNSVTNERIIRESDFRNVYIMPAAEDSGTAIGAAYYGYLQLSKSNNRRKLVHDSVGRSYGEWEISRALEKIPAVELLDSEEVVSDAVNLLREGHIVGWFQGRSELGPRALGQRSILCDPRRPDGKAVLNSRVKHREAFRPFAPVVLFEEVDKWFDLEGAEPASPFMLRICKFREEKKGLVPAVVHVDDTGRFQTVASEANGRLYELVKKFGEQTGVPIILNTSFNVMGEPIVETPEDALLSFLSTGIDFCVLENKLVGKRKRILFDEEAVPWPERVGVEVAKAVAAGPDGEPVPPRRPSEYAGRFEHPVFGRITVEEEDGGLKGTITDCPPLFSRMRVWTSPFRHKRGDIFELTAAPFAGREVVFVADRGGHIDSVALMLKGLLPSDIIFCGVASETADDAGLRARVAGEYGDGARELSVRLKGRDGLVAAAVAGQSPLELTFKGGGRYAVKNIPGYNIEFTDDGSGGVAEAIVTQPSGVFTLKKR